MCGDADGNGEINIGDIVYLINYLFKDGPDPWPGLCVGDATGDGEVNIADVVKVVGYLFRGAAPPMDGCCDLPE